MKVPLANRRRKCFTVKRQLLPADPITGTMKKTDTSATIDCVAGKDGGYDCDFDYELSFTVSRFTTIVYRWTATQPELLLLLLLSAYRRCFLFITTTTKYVICSSTANVPVEIIWSLLLID